MPVSERLVELRENGFCVLRARFAAPLIRACREAFWPTLLRYIDTHCDAPNRGPSRHFLPMPFEPPCFAPEFFLDADVLSIVRQVLNDQMVADQWGCDAPVKGSIYQEIHVDYKRPLFPELPDLVLPTYMLVVSFGLIDITLAHGPIEIAAGTHRMPRHEAMRAVELAQIKLEPVVLEIGDVLIRHPWTLHRGTPNTTDVPRALLTIRYVRRWYADSSRDVHPIPQHVWRTLSEEQRNMMRFPVLDT